ncbi:hypothetical protein U8527_08625 [Kordia algicida OT-1]|uniref:Uncharacterized protein n=1 Tax=Kordia algicida OT-1 TaxID=391587 RepID=A9E6S5_9FLAO|nr:hypothetical protein [Kordia algicida]EDP95079.1 hypothetical protein KAOT1_02049 [Kordia algicida OT-1]
MQDNKRINIEWVLLNALRGILKIATRGNNNKTTYKKVQEVGSKLSPDILGENNSILYRNNKSMTAKAFLQKARLQSYLEEKEISAVKLITEEIDSIEILIKKKFDNSPNKELKARLTRLKNAKKELSSSNDDTRKTFAVIEESSQVKRSEYTLINRDSFKVDRNVKPLYRGDITVDYYLSNGNILRIRSLHPDKLEHITGADIIYECHDQDTKKISLAFLQYKIWRNKKLYLKDDRLQKQISKITNNTCNKGICKCKTNDEAYRFPFCSGFLRPTDEIQDPNAYFISTGYHLPICLIEKATRKGMYDGEYISQESIKKHSVSSQLFEELFNNKKIGSKSMTPEELNQFYSEINVDELNDTVIIYAQEINKYQQ